jgi:AraC-like DNA-binding protein
MDIEHVTKPDYYIFYYVKEGKGYVTEKGATHRVEAGQGFVVFPNEETRIKSEYKKSMNVTWVAFSGYLVERYLGRARLTAYEPIFLDNEQHEVEEMFDELLAVSTTLPNRYCKIMAQLYSIFGFLLDHIRQDALPEAATPEYYLIKALDFIDGNYMEDINVEDIASNAGLSRKALYGVFKSLTGFPPKDYLIYYRMCKASAMLKDVNLSIEVVATSVGYRDQFHFSKEFKKNVGLSPSAYRKEILQDPSKEFKSPVEIVRQQFPVSGTMELPPRF